MKRLFLISLMLLLVWTVYADGPRYRFKSRRALQSLWRKEMSENPQYSKYGSKNRKLTPREMNGENTDKLKNTNVYGIVVDNPFDEDDLQYGSESSRRKPPVFGGTFDGLVIPTYPGKKNDDEPQIVIGKKTVDEPDNPFVGGTTTSGTGSGEYAPPVMPVGDGIPVLLILTATLIAIKKRLSK